MDDSVVLGVEALVKTFPPDGRAGWRRRQPSSGGVVAVDSVDFQVREGQLFTLLGPSGCGKTTTLRSVAGLEKPDRGRISVAGSTVFSAVDDVDVPPNRRRLGMVFQSYAIWPHLDVFGNVAFPLLAMGRRSRPGRAQVHAQVTEALDLVRMAHLADRPAAKLSGGQQQRLALARALVGRPALLLLDEPLSNLDAQLRESMRVELQRLQQELGLTAVYVTHDQHEALAISSLVGVMSDGRLVQVGTPREVYDLPSSRFVAEFVGASNLISGLAGPTVSGQMRVETDHGPLWVADPPTAAPGTPVLVAVRPEHVVVSTRLDGGDGVNERRGTVRTTSYLGDTLEHLLVVAGEELRARTSSAVALPVDVAVRVTLPPHRLRIVAPD